MEMLYLLHLLLTSLVFAVATIQSDKRVIGGDSASPTEFPWNAQLQVGKNLGPDFNWQFGAGTLISQLWILTDGEFLRNSTAWYASLGTNKYMGAPTYDNVIVSGIRHYISPPSQRNISQPFYVGLVELDEPLAVANLLIRPIPFFGSDRDSLAEHASFANKYVKICGFGASRKKYSISSSAPDRINFN